MQSYFVRFTRPIQVPDGDEGLLVRFGGSVAQVAEGTALVNLEAICGDDKVLGAVKVEVRL